MVPIGGVNPYPVKDCYVTVLDGRVLGYVYKNDAAKIVDRLRLLKIEGHKVSVLVA